MKRKTILWTGSALVAWVLMAAGWPGPALADEPSTVEDVIVILQERGVIDEEDATRMVERNRAYENKKSWTDRLSFFGDFRGRYDGIWYDHDPLGDEHKDRSRLRYRFRVGANAEINDHFDLTFRLSSSCEHRSGNQTLGRGSIARMGARISASTGIRTGSTSTRRTSPSTPSGIARSPMQGESSTGCSARCRTCSSRRSARTSWSGTPTSRRRARR